jgi:hypothetical protein
MRNIRALVVTIKLNYCNYCMKQVVSHNISLWNIDGHNMRITSGCLLKMSVQNVWCEWTWGVKCWKCGKSEYGKSQSWHEAHYVSCIVVNQQVWFHDGIMTGTTAIHNRSNAFQREKTRSCQALAMAQLDKLFGIDAPHPCTMYLRPSLVSDWLQSVFSSVTMFLHIWHNCNCDWKITGCNWTDSLVTSNYSLV